MKKVSEEILGQGKWIALKRTSFVDDQGTPFSWEHIERIGTKHAVVILATLKPSNDILLIRQFRPGANGYVLGLPAGMMEADAISPGHEALRELLEETGYVGTVTDVGPVVSSFPALSDATMQLVQAEIDETLPENINPTQHLEPGELISTLRVPKAQMRKFLEEEAAKGTQIVSGLWYMFAL